MDSTAVKVHESANSGGKKREPKAVGRTKGGLNTKIHALTDALGNLLEFLLTSGNVHDSTVAVELLSRLDLTDSNVLADKAYGTNQILNYIQSADSEYTIPTKSNTVRSWHCDWHIYKDRHVIECFFQKLKWFRRIATRYDKRNDVFLSGVFLASTIILLK